MFGTKLNVQLSASLLLIVLSGLSFQSANAATKTKLYIVFDSSNSMRHAQSPISQLLTNLHEELEVNSTLRESVRLIDFKEKITLDRVTSLTKTAEIVSKTTFEDSTENVLPVLNLLADDPSVSDAMMIIFSDGRHQDLKDINMESLIKRFAQKHMHVQVFQNFPTWCDNKAVVAVNKEQQVLTSDGSFIDCSAISHIKNRRYGKLSEANKLSQLAFGTNGYVWPISKLNKFSRTQETELSEFINTAANTLAVELLLKAEQSLKAIVEYPKSVSVDEMVFFEVISNLNDADVGEITHWEWDFDNDGQHEDVGTLTSRAFDKPGDYLINLKLSNDDIPVVTTVMKLPITVIEPVN